MDLEPALCQAHRLLAGGAGADVAQRVEANTLGHTRAVRRAVRGPSDFWEHPDSYQGSRIFNWVPTTERQSAYLHKLGRLRRKPGGTPDSPGRAGSPLRRFLDPRRQEGDMEQESGPTQSINLHPVSPITLGGGPTKHNPRPEGSIDIHPNRLGLGIRDAQPTSQEPGLRETENAGPHSESMARRNLDSSPLDAPSRIRPRRASFAYGDIPHNTAYDREGQSNVDPQVEDTHHGRHHSKR